MMNKVCLVLIATALGVTPVCAGVTMVTKTTAPSGKCDFRVDKCQTEVSEDPDYTHFRDGSSHLTSKDTVLGSADPGLSQSRFAFKDYPSTHVETVAELLADIRAKLSKCPEVELYFNEDTGDITVHYLKATCDCDCDWTLNIRDIQASDFLWTRSTDNYSPRLGQMERRKFHTVNENDAQDIQADFAGIRSINNWSLTTVTVVRH